MSAKSGFTNGQLLNHGTIAHTFSRTEAVVVVSTGTLEVTFAGEGNAVVNFGTVVPVGTLLPIAIKNTTTNNTVDLILLR